MHAIPEQFQHVHYDSARIPGIPNQADLSLGANCQVFAYAILKDQGRWVPNHRSSELWADTIHTERVTEFQFLDIMLYHDNPEAFGAHVGLYWGNGEVLHLSKDNGLPKLEKHTELLKQPKYAYFIGAKRVKITS